MHVHSGIIKLLPLFKFHTGQNLDFVFCLFIIFFYFLSMHIENHPDGRLSSIKT